MDQFTSSTNHCCGLCSGQSASFVHQHSARPIEGRRYLRCNHCGLIQVEQRHRLSLTEEKSVYDLHGNDPGDAHYRLFLSQLTTPLIKLLHQHQSVFSQWPPEGLDFGSGPGPTLSGIMREQGFNCVDYDIFYAPNAKRLQAEYGFITATEVFEHLAEPAKVLDQLNTNLEPGGFLALMMQRPDEQDNFANWGYIRDPTHISFYTNQALRYISNRWSLKECHRDRNVIIWQTHSNSSV